MTERYRVEPTGRGFWPFRVVAGDGTRELFIGHRKSCERVAAELKTAFRDGEFVGRRDYDALRAEAEALRAENELKQQTIDGMNAEHWKLVQAHAELRTDLEAARGLLERVHDGLEKGYPLIKTAEKIRAFLTATPAPEVQAEQGERQEAVPEETPHIIVFDDADRPNEVFSGAGARPAALRRWEQISVSWNAHLFVRVEKNSRDDPNPCARLATTPQPGPDVRALVAALGERHFRTGGLAHVVPRCQRNRHGRLTGTDRRLDRRPPPGATPGRPAMTAIVLWIALSPVAAALGCILLRSDKA